MKGRPPEIHLFVIWEHGRFAADRIAADVRAHFTILAGFEVVWSDRPGHFSRLYGQSLPVGSDKVEKCGMGPFLVLVVEDRSPRYGKRRKWGRKVVTNTAMFDAKARYRSWTGAHRVHNSSDPDEADRDLFVLLGRRAHEFRDRSIGTWDGQLERVVRDPAGTDGWRSRQELLTAVELTLPYVLLPDPEPSSPVRRIRLLVEAAFDEWGVEWLIASPDDVRMGERGPEYPFVLEGAEAVLELHHVGDGDMPAPWQEALLRGRRRDASGAFVPPPDECFYALLQAVLVSGEEPSEQQGARLAAAARAIGAPTIDYGDRTAAAAVLDAHVGQIVASQTQIGRAARSHRRSLARFGKGRPR